METPQVFYRRKNTRLEYLAVLLPSVWWCGLWWIWLFGGPPHRWHRGTQRSSHKTLQLQCCHHRSCRATGRWDKHQRLTHPQRVRRRWLVFEQANQMRSNLQKCQEHHSHSPKNQYQGCPHMVMHSVTNLDCPLHCAAGSLNRVLHKDVFHHIHLHTLLPAHRTADHIHWKPNTHGGRNQSNWIYVCIFVYIYKKKKLTHDSRHL